MENDGELPYFTLCLSLLFEYFMIYTACIIQKRKDKQLFKNFLFTSQKKTGSFCSWYKFDRTHLRVQDKYKLPICSNKNTVCFLCWECSSLWYGSLPHFPQVFQLSIILSEKSSLIFLHKMTTSYTHPTTLQLPHLLYISLE